MKFSIEVCRLLQLVIIINCMMTGPLRAQTFRTLHVFSGADGASPQGSLTVSGNTLYGTAIGGGTWTNGTGTVFKLNTDGTGFQVLHSFTPISANATGFAFTNSDGAVPVAGLVLSGDTLYGTALRGGQYAFGTVFALQTNGLGFRVLHGFASPPDGATPESGLILYNNLLYGTTTFGGAYPGYGTVFSLNPNGTGLVILHNFAYTTEGEFPGELTLSGDILYGGASSGGGGCRCDPGSLFSLDITHNTFAVLLSFAAPVSPGSVILSNNIIYGTTYLGSTNFGAVFAISADGTGFTNLHVFGNSDGAYPNGRLVLRGGNLFGEAGGSLAWGGTIFTLKTDGTSFTVLHSFSATSGYPNGTNSDGGAPNGGLLLNGNAVYGVTSVGGSCGFGTVFSISFVPELAINKAGSNVIVSWPTDCAGFDYTG